MMRNTEVRQERELPWVDFAEHRQVGYQELLPAAKADALRVAVSSILRERIEPGGAVLPHYHDVAEVIHITRGEVRLLMDGRWREFGAGDTFLVPAGAVHAVANRGANASEQISIFLPVSEMREPNAFFATHQVAEGRDEA
ncbi:cupin domain-containing protein [Paenibacillus sp. IB182496]|uniref:Cupin domain-containing protein n=1 Tax=Paenibacillus sabuli TaxID=2772509 RepID=A0A927GSS8_9BACL|nr:cupin domain-containing protein [Paenibacillus sabuli]MBD2847079.1 cupin domain-containing protein [Paenibacillus sabuli]